MKRLQRFQALFLFFTVKLPDCSFQKQAGGACSFFAENQEISVSFSLLYLPSVKVCSIILKVIISVKYAKRKTGRQNPL